MLQVLVWAACAAALVPAFASAAADPLTALQTEVSKLGADVDAAHAAVAADVASIISDVQTAQGTDSQGARSTAKADLRKLLADIRSARSIVRSDRHALPLDAKVAYESKADVTLLRSLLADARTQMEQFRADVTSALRQVAQTLRGLRLGPQK